MTIDDYPLSDEILAFCKAAIQDMPDALLVSGARKMPDFFKGLKQDKPNTDLLRQRVLAKLQLKSPPPPILDILRTATLPEALVDCYQSDAKHGVVLLRDGASESETLMLVAINSDPSQVDDMIDRLCNLRGMSTAASAGTAVN
jgi:hypothetical protein